MFLGGVVVEIQLTGGKGASELYTTSGLNVNKGNSVQSSSDENVKDISPKEVSRRELNIAILQAHQDVSINIKDQPQALVYKAAIDSINEKLEADFGKDAIQRTAESGIDVSPEATAERIVRLSTQLFSSYQKQNPELDTQEQVDRFVDVISGGIDTGFGEARDILDGLGVLEGEISENIDKTYSLVQEGLTSFRDQFSTVSSETAE